MKTALLLSGGMDSTAIAFWLKPDIAITIDYGQLSFRGELRAAKKICAEIGLEQVILTMDCRDIGSGDLAGTQALACAPVPEWWPFRNQFLITMGAMKAVSMQVDTLYFGSVSTDAAHADGRPEFFSNMSRLLSLQEGSISLEAPAITMRSEELIRKSGISPSLLYWSHSCHRSEYACGLCRGCSKHMQVLEALGLETN